MNIKLTQEEMNLLLHIIPSNIIPNIVSGKSFSKDEMDIIRDICGEKLQEIGFDKNYDLTQEGEILETLIDKFYINQDESSKKND